MLPLVSRKSSSRFRYHLLRYASRFYGRRKAMPVNTVINFVPQQEAWVIERFGKFARILEPGLAILIPFIEEIKYTQSLKEIAIEVPSQSAITLDNVTLQLDGVLYYRIEQPYQASYGVEDCEYAVTQLAQTTMRSELGKITLDKIFQERTSLNANIVNAINEAASAWGMKCLRYEIRDIQLPSKVKEAMQMQVEAERKKRAAILESEGTKVAAINVAEGEKQSQILASEGRKAEQINIATGEANAILAKANARAEGILKIAAALARQSGDNAAALTVAEQYVQAFSNIAKTSNTVVLPANTGDAASMVAQAMAVYGQVTKPAPPTDHTPSGDPNNKGTASSAKDTTQLAENVNTEAMNSRRENKSSAGHRGDIQENSTKVAAINVAEGEKQSQILASEGRKAEQINIATGEANAILAKANARAEGILKIAAALARQSGDNAAALTVAEQYVQAFSNIAKTSNTVVLPANTGDAASMVAQATAVYGQVTKPAPPTDDTPSGDPNNKGTASSAKDTTQLAENDKTEAMDSRSENRSSADHRGSIQQNSEWHQIPSLSHASHFTAAKSPTRKRDFL